MIFRLARPLAALAIATLTVGCALQAPRYQPSLDNVEILKKTAGPVALGAFTVQPGATGSTSVTLRASPMNSPVGADYAAYLADALQQELTLARKLDPKSNVVITGVLLKNDIAAGGIITNSGEIEALFAVTRDGQQRYSQVKRAELSWDSSFIGAVAIPRAQQQYPQVVQKLTSLLLADPDFLAALK